MSPRVFVYILTTIFRSIGRFFAHWYTQGSGLYWQSVLDFLGELERMVSLRITALNWFRPLYGDYSRLGIAIGIPIRLMRILATLVLYAFVLTFFAAGYAVYLVLPMFLVSRLA